MILNGEKMLITCDEFFCAPDGKFYRAIYGRVWIHRFDESFGFKAHGHANWMVRVCRDEDNENGVTIAGCRVNYAVKMEETPALVVGNFVSTLQGGLFYPSIYVV